MGKKSKGKGKAPKGRAGAKEKAKQSGQRNSDGLSSFIRASGRRDMLDDEGRFDAAVSPVAPS